MIHLSADNMDSFIVHRLKQPAQPPVAKAQRSTAAWHPLDGLAVETLVLTTN